MEQENRNKLVIDTTLLAGKLLMQSGAETERVEDTMKRILKQSVPPEAEKSVRTFVILNSIFVGVDATQSSFLPINTRSYNLDVITQVNQISRHYHEGQLTLEETYHHLRGVETQKENNLSLKMLLAAAILGGSTALLFGGVPADFPAAAVAGLVSYLIYHSIRLVIDIPFICEFCAAFVAGFSGLLAMQLIGVNQDIIMMGAVITLVPGIAITNAIRDIMQRHYLTGFIRFLESLFIGASLSGGITLVTLVYSWLT